LQKLKREKPYEEELSLVKQANRDVNILPTLEIISHSANNGVKSINHLQRDFSAIYDTNYIALNAGGNFFGTIKACVTYYFAPKLHDEGLVPGDDPKSIITRAQHFLNKGSLGKTITELKHLPKPLATIFQQWMEDASKRIEADTHFPKIEQFIQTNIQHQIKEYEQL